MAATNFTPIQLYFSTTASAVPLAANLAQGELAININDGKLYYEDSAGAVQVIATKGAGTIGGSTTQIQYNNAGALAGNAAMVFNSATSTTTLTTLNLTNALGAIYGGTAQSTYTQGDILYSSASNTLAKLGIGTTNYILTSSGSIPQWVAPSSIAVLTATNLAGGLAGSVPYQSALDTTTFLAIGAANRVMTSTGTAPQWVTALTGLTGVSSSSITDTGLTSGRVTYASTGGLLVDSSSLTFNGTTLTTAGLSNSGFSTLVKTLTLGDTSFNGTAVFAAATPAKLYMGTGTVTDVTSAISATNTTGAIASLAITPIAATNTGVTYTNASTLYIAGAPSAGTNVTITNPYSLYVAAGAVYLGGNTAVTGTLSATGNISATAGGFFSTKASGNSPILDLTQTGVYTWDLINTATTGLFSIRGNTTPFLSIASATGAVTIPQTLGVTGVSTLTAGAVVQGLTVGLGAGAVSTNTAVGASALAANTSGSANTAIGYGSLGAITGGSRNTAVGYLAGTVTTGDYNTAVGWSALSLNTSGQLNTAVGDGALQSNTIGGENSSVGQGSLTFNTEGNKNTALGRQALASNTTASNNTAVGYQAGYTNSTGTLNNLIGYQAGYSSSTSNSLVYIGNQAGYYQTGGSSVAIGYRSQYGASGTSTGNYNISVGENSLLALTSGSYNTALGVQTLQANTTASNNTAVGYQAGYSNVTGSYNTAIGIEAFYTNTSANYNTAVGYQAGYKSNFGGSGGYNTLFGSVAGHELSSGAFNTCVGGAAGYYMTTGSGNVHIGGQTAAGGYYPAQAITTQDNYISIGSTSTTNAYIQVAWTVVSDLRDKIVLGDVPLGLDFVQKLKPIKYQFTETRGDNTPHGDVKYGFGAQDILALEGGNPIIIDNKDEERLRYNGESLVPVLVKAIQELKSQLDSVKAELATLKGA